jgi:HEAT repeat protein
MSLFCSPNVKRLLKKKKYEKLIEFVDHKWVNIRKEAIEALGVLSDRRSTEILLKKLLNEHSRDVHDTIATALADINDPAIVSNIQALLLIMKNADEHKFNKEALIKILDMSQDKSAALPLIFLLDDMEYFSIRASKALTKKGTEIIPLLQSFLFAEGEPFYKDSKDGGRPGTHNKKRELALKRPPKCRWTQALNFAPLQDILS